MMIEAVFSVFIVGAVLVSFLAVMSGVYKQEFGKRDYVIATNLAQEGIEIVRNIRDNNWKNNAIAFKSPPFPANNTGYCVAYNVDYSINAPTTGCVATTVKLKKNASGFYEYSAGTDTKFSRNINVANNLADSTAKDITSTVTWSGKTITMTDTLYAWGDL